MVDLLNPLCVALQHSTCMLGSCYVKLGREWQWKDANTVGNSQGLGLIICTIVCLVCVVHIVYITLNYLTLIPIHLTHPQLQLHDF